jgi:hypothetical protein
MICSARIVETVPEMDAKFYAPGARPRAYPGTGPPAYGRHVMTTVTDLDLPVFDYTAPGGTRDSPGMPRPV